MKPAGKNKALEPWEIAYGNSENGTRIFNIGKNGKQWRPNILNIKTATDAEWKAFFKWMIDSQRGFSMSDRKQGLPLQNPTISDTFTNALNRLSEALSFTQKMPDGTLKTVNVDLTYQQMPDGTQETYEHWMLRNGFLLTDLRNVGTVFNGKLYFENKNITVGKKTEEPKPTPTTPVVDPVIPDNTVPAVVEEPKKPKQPKQPKQPVSPKVEDLVTPAQVEVTTKAAEVEDLETPETIEIVDSGEVDTSDFDWMNGGVEAPVETVIPEVKPKKRGKNEPTPAEEKVNKKCK